jgi:hypothetical protein
MASLVHEAIVELLRNRPELALDLLTRAVPVKIGERERADAHIESVDLGDAKPLERSADFVVRFGTDEPAIRIISEVQTSPDPDKRLSWPGYVAISWARTGQRTYLLVITLDDAVARWAAQPIDVGHFAFRPIVVGPELIPVVVDVEQACASPELAVLSVRAHRDRPEVVDVAAAALIAVEGLEESTARFYRELVFDWLPHQWRAILEAEMDIKQEFISDWSREKIAEGRVEGKADALLRVLGARGIAVPAAAAERIRACKDAAVLDAWLDRAVGVESVEALFD